MKDDGKRSVSREDREVVGGGGCWNLGSTGWAIKCENGGARLQQMPELSATEQYVFIKIYEQRCLYT